MSYIGDVAIGAFLLTCLLYGGGRGFSLGLFTLMGSLAIVVLALFEHPHLGVHYQSWLSIDTNRAQLYAFVTICGVLGLVLIGFRAFFRRVTKNGLPNLLDTALGSGMWAGLGALLVVIALMFAFFLTSPANSERIYRSSAFVRLTFEHLPVPGALKGAFREDKTRPRHEAAGDVVEAFKPKVEPAPKPKPKPKKPNDESPPY